MPQPSRHRPALVAVALALVAGALVAPPASAAPVEPLFQHHIDRYADYDGAHTCNPPFKPGVVAFRALVLAAYPGTSGAGERSCSGGSSEHHEGRALDWMVDASDPVERGYAEDLIDWLLAPDEYGNPNANARRFGIMYMIWNREVWKAYDPDDGWQDYTGSNPHVDHIHFSFSWPGARAETTWTTGQDAGQRYDEARPAATWRNAHRLDVFRRGSDGRLALITSFIEPAPSRSPA